MLRRRRVFREPPGERRSLQANVRDCDHLPEGGLAHRPSREIWSEARPLGIDERAIVVDIEADPERIDARVAFGEELCDEGICALRGSLVTPRQEMMRDTSTADISSDPRGEWPLRRSLSH